MIHDMSDYYAIVVIQGFFLSRGSRPGVYVPPDCIRILLGPSARGLKCRADGCIRLEGDFDWNEIDFYASASSPGLW